MLKYREFFYFPKSEAPPSKPRGILRGFYEMSANERTIPERSTNLLIYSTVPHEFWRKTHENRKEHTLGKFGQTRGKCEWENWRLSK